MCGLFGIYYFDQSTRPDPAQLKATATLLTHRGPDNQSYYASAGVGLAHTRLSLLDLQPRSNQPLWDASGRYCIVYNGEVYNYLPLRERLEAQGIHFRTSSDTEVLLYALITHGRQAVGEFHGMYAFAFYDSAAHTLLLARDPFGIKPLYVLETPSAILFSSEIKGFRPWQTPEPAMDVIFSYAAGLPMPTQPATFFAGVRSVRAGGYVTVAPGGKANYGTFFSLGDLYDEDQYDRLSSAKAESVIDEAEDLLTKSVRQHMIADAPVGAFCSGGIDSALILALAAQKHDNLAVFHADVVGPHSELRYAELLAKHLNLDLHVTKVTDADFIGKMTDVISHYEQPFTYHPNSVPFLAVSALVHHHKTKAVLTGEGADECLLGYSHLPLQPLLTAGRRALVASNRAISRTPFIGSRIALPNCDEAATVHSIPTALEIQLERETIAKRLGAKSPKGTATTLEYLGYHLRTLLTRNDRLGMAAHIEARFPFLDLDFVRFSANVPYRYKIRKGTLLGSDFKHPLMGNKWVLRKVAERHLPRGLSARPKRGFPTNAYERMRIDPGFLRGSYIAEMFGLDGMRSRALWEATNVGTHLRFAHLEIWGRRCVLGESSEHVQELLAPYLQI